ncbi:MAG: DoxX family protein [Flavobacteriales bacterium]
MKRTNTAYCIITALFSAFMIFSSIGGITLHPDAITMLHDHLGYPLYFIRWISVFKIIGAIAILLPMVPAR